MAHERRFCLPVPVSDRGVQSGFPDDVQVSILTHLADGAQSSTDTCDLGPFCEACQKILNDTSDYAKPCSLELRKGVLRDPPQGVTREFVHHDNGGRGLRDAVNGGCPLCLHIWLSLPKKERQDICEDHMNTGFAALDFATMYNTLSPKGFKNYIMKYTCRRFELL
jgi:hypothetical protein